MHARSTNARHRAVWSMLLLTLPAGAAFAAYTLDWHVVAGGGTQHAVGGPWRLGATIAQAAPGLSSGGAWELSAGYWVAAPLDSDLIFQHDFEVPSP